MRTTSNSLILLAPAALLFASPLRAEVAEDGAPPASIAAWVETVNERLEDAIAKTRGVTGSATAIFRRASDGRATDVEIVAASPAMEQATRATLARLGQLPALPQGVAPDQRIKLQLLFEEGLDSYSFEKKVHALLAKADAENARFSGGQTRMAANLAQIP